MGGTEKDCKMEIEIMITWHKGKPVNLRFGDRLIWETKEVISDTNFLTTILKLPVLEAVQFCSIFVNGMAIKTLAVLYESINKKMIEWKNLQAKEQEQSLEWQDW